MALITANIFLDVLIFIGTLAYGLYLYFTWSFDYWKKRNVPYLKPIAFFGNFLEVSKQTRQIGVHLAHLYREKSAKCLGIWVLHKPHLMVNDPGLIKNILIKDFTMFSDRTIFIDLKADPYLSKGLFASKNPGWKNMRSKMTPIFTSGKIKGMVPLVTESAEQLVIYLNKQSKAVEAKELCAKYSTQIIASCAFGLEANCFQDENAPFRAVGRTMFDFSRKNGLRMFSYFFAPFLVKMFKIGFFEPSVYDFCKEVFLSTINSREETKAKRNDFIDMIIELKKNGLFKSGEFDDESIVAQAVQFYAAGFETSSSTMSFLLYQIAMNPDIQNKLRADIEKVREKHEGRIDYESIKDMNYLDQVIKETLRLYPILPFLDRKCAEEYQLDHDLIIEKGTPIYIPIYALHHDEQYFPNPEVFDPERFSNENISKIVPYSYLPFGQGPRNCIGERFAGISSKMGIVHILTNFLVETTEDTPKVIELDPRGVTLQSKIGLYLRFCPIEASGA